MPLMQKIALAPAEWLVRFSLMLFGLELEQVPYGWQVVLIGVVAFIFWLHVTHFIIGVIKRRIFGYYGDGV